jgi:putative redox protein
VHVSVEWRGGETFVGREVVLDAERTPMEVLLVAFGACDGTSVVDLLRKMRQEVTAYQIHLTGEQRDEHPRVFTQIHVEHVFTGRALDQAKVSRAVELSAQYCPVGATLRLAAEVTESVRVLPED